PQVAQLNFDPAQTRADITAPVELDTPDFPGPSIGPGRLQAVGTGRDKVKVFIDRGSLVDALEQLTAMSSPQLIRLQFRPAAPSAAGSFTLSFRGQRTAPIRLSTSAISPSAITTALEGLSTIGAGNVDVDVRTTPPLRGQTAIQVNIRITFIDALAGPQDLIAVSASGNNLVRVLAVVRTADYS